MHINEVAIFKNDLMRCADGLILLREQADSAWLADRMTTTATTLRAMLLESDRWVMMPEEDLNALKREAATA